MAKAQKNFLTGALILTVANAMVKVIGAFYKIPLANLITPAGMNYYNDAYQIYSLLFVLSTAGIPTAITIMVSEAVAQKRLTEPKKVLKLSTLIFSTLGILLAALLMIGVEPLSKLLSNDTTNYCISMIAPAIFFVAVSAPIKGYFQGYKCMTPSATFQVLEASFKLVGLGLVGILIAQGQTNPMVLACGGVLGVTFGSFAATAYMLIRLLTEKDFGRDTTDSLPSRNGRSISKTIFTLAIPISLSSAVTSVASTLDMILVKWNLSQYGLEQAAVIDTYGAYVGSTSSLFNLPQALTIGIGSALLPFLTSAFATNNKEEAYKNLRSAGKLMALIALPCGVGMSVMSEPIMKTLFVSSYWDVGITTLRLLALSTVFVSFVSLTGTALHSIGKVAYTLISMGLGATAKIVVNIIAVQNLGIIGAPMGTFIGYCTIVGLNLFFIHKHIGFHFPLKETFLKPLLCSVICCAAAFGVWKLLSFAGLSILLSLVAALAVAVAVYAVMLLLFKVLAKEDMTFIPKGEKIGAFLEKKGWIHE